MSARSRYAPWYRSVQEEAQSRQRRSAEQFKVEEFEFGFFAWVDVPGREVFSADEMRSLSESWGEIPWHWGK